MRCFTSNAQALFWSTLVHEWHYVGRSSCALINWSNYTAHMPVKPWCCEVFDTNISSPIKMVFLAFNLHSPTALSPQAASRQRVIMNCCSSCLCNMVVSCPAQLASCLALFRRLFVEGIWRVCHVITVSFANLKCQSGCAEQLCICWQHKLSGFFMLNMACASHILISCNITIRRHAQYT